MKGRDVNVVDVMVVVFECTTHGVSSTGEMPAYGAATEYRHSLFEARLRHPEKLQSERPLAWDARRTRAGKRGVL